MRKPIQMRKVAQLRQQLSILNQNLMLRLPLPLPPYNTPVTQHLRMIL